MPIFFSYLHSLPFASLNLQFTFVFDIIFNPPFSSSSLIMPSWCFIHIIFAFVIFFVVRISLSFFSILILILFIVLFFLSNPVLFFIISFFIITFSFALLLTFLLDLLLVFVFPIISFFHLSLHSFFISIFEFGPVC